MAPSKTSVTRAKLREQVHCAPPFDRRPVPSAAQSIAPTTAVTAGAARPSRLGRHLVDQALGLVAPARRGRRRGRRRRRGATAPRRAGPPPPLRPLAGDSSSPAGPPASITSVISPFDLAGETQGKLGQRTASDLLVHLGELAADGAGRVGRQGREAGEAARQARCPVSKATTRPPQRRQPSQAAAGRPPVAADSRRSENRRRAARPEATTAVTGADGPGSTVRARPAAAAAATSRSPGSEMPGRPASVTRATS